MKVDDILQKIGIKKCTDSKIDFYIKDVKIIKFNDLSVKISKISSCIVTYKVIDIDFLEISNTIRINIIYNINILYITQGSNDVHSYEKEIPAVEYISSENFLHGVSAKKIFMKNKFKLEIYIENISCENIKNHTIIVSYMYICAINIIKDFSISYIMDNTISENIYSSFYDGENLIQNTNMIDLKISKLGYQVVTKDVVFIGEVDGYSDVYICKNKNSIYGLKNIINVENVNDYSFVNKNNLVLLCVNNLQSYIYTLNIITNKSKRLNIGNKYEGISNLKYNKIDNNIFFTCKIDHKKCFCKVDINSNVDILFNHYDIIDYLIIEKIQKAILRVEKDNSERIFLLDLNNNILSPIILNMEYIEIRSFLYLENKENDYSILFLLKCENEVILLEYRLNNFQINIIYSHNEIECLGVSNSSKDIFVVTKDINFYEVIKINNSNTQSILKTHSYIKEIHIYNN